MSASRVIGRRAVLVGGAGVAAAWALSSSPSASGLAVVGRGSSRVATALPAVQPWLPGEGEVDPQVKLRAVQLIEAIGTWSAGGSGIAEARNRVAALGLSPSLALQALPLLSSAPAAVTRVIDAQYGGILSSSSSVMVVLEQWLQRPSGNLIHRGTTVDVRLVGAQPRWRVVALHPAHPGAAVAARPLAAAVLANPRIRLPFAARADVASGAVHDSVLQCITTLARDHTLNVSVMRSGHPIYVFGTNRHSDHPRGRAVDIWSIDSRPVVHHVNRSLVIATMRRAAELGPYQVGGPVLLSGSNTAYFSDQTHQDHIHLGFSA